MRVIELALLIGYIAFAIFITKSSQKRENILNTVKIASRPELRSRNGWSAKRLVYYENTKIIIIVNCNYFNLVDFFTKNAFVSMKTISRHYKCTGPDTGRDPRNPGPEPPTNRGSPT